MQIDLPHSHYEILHSSAYWHPTLCYNSIFQHLFKQNINKIYIAPIERCAKLRGSERSISMGTKKQWTGQEKLAIVLQGLKGECNISELCNEHGITGGYITNGVISC